MQCRFPNWTFGRLPQNPPGIFFKYRFLKPTPRDCDQAHLSSFSYTCFTSPTSHLDQTTYSFPNAHSTSYYHACTYGLPTQNALFLCLIGKLLLIFQNPLKRILTCQAFPHPHFLVLPPSTSCYYINGKHNYLPFSESLLCMPYFT